MFVKEGQPAAVSAATKAASALSQEEWLEYRKPVWTLPAPSRADPAWGKQPVIMPTGSCRQGFFLLKGVAAAFDAGSGWRPGG